MSIDDILQKLDRLEKGLDLLGALSGKIEEILKIVRNKGDKESEQE